MLGEYFSRLDLGGNHKDYKKECYSVKYGDSELSLKFPKLKIVTEPRQGDKFFYASLCKKDDSLLNFFEALDIHLSEKMPEKYANMTTPTFKTDDKIAKLYLPYKQGVLNLKKMKIYDSKKNIVDIEFVKEGMEVKVLSYLKQFKRYREEIIPMWIVEQIQIQEPKQEPEQEPKQEPEQEPKQEPEQDAYLYRNHAILEKRDKILIEQGKTGEDTDSEDFSDSDYHY